MIELVTSKVDIDSLRNNYNEKYFSRLYDGWSDEFDKEYDSRSKWYSTRSKNTYCRVTYGNRFKCIPIESSGFKVPCRFNNWAEINNFNYPREEKREAIQLIEDVFKELVSQKISVIFAVVDTNLRIPYKLNTETFGFTDLGRIVTFNDIYYLNSEKLVEWKLLSKTLIA